MTLRVTPSSRQGPPAQRLLGRRPLTLMGCGYEARYNPPPIAATCGAYILDLPGEAAPFPQPPQPPRGPSLLPQSQGLRQGRPSPWAGRPAGAAAGKGSQSRNSARGSLTLRSDDARLSLFPARPECWHFTDNFQNRALPFLDYI